MKKLPLSSPAERIIGFTIPRDGSFQVCDHDEVWSVQIGPPLSVEESDRQPYEVAAAPNFVGWGETNNAFLGVGEIRIDYKFDSRSDHVRVEVSTGSATEAIDFPTFSGDWFAASLSDDGRHLVLAEPNRIDLYEVG